MDLTAYSPAVRSVLHDDRLPELGPGRPNAAVRPTLSALTTDSLFASASVCRADLAQCCLAGLWLYHDYLDESHTLSQDIACAEGSYWHGIMHRREPDFSNAGYWFRRVGKHPIFEPLCRRAAELATEAGAPFGSEFLTQQAAWDPFAFIDLSQAATTRDATTRDAANSEMLCRRIQRVEWQLLFEFCSQQAVGA